MKSSLRCAIILVVAASCSSVGVMASVSDAFQDYELVPDVVPVAPPAIAEVSYPSGVIADLGNELTPTQVKDEPTVTWGNSPDNFYTLALIDPDVPSRENPTNSPLLHWLVVNIKGVDLSSGEVIAEYIGSGPPEGTGLHRYVFLAYQQSGQLTFDEQKIPNTTAENRARYPFADFVKKYNLGDPRAGNFFQAQYDDHVPILMKQLGA